MSLFQSSWRLRSVSSKNAWISLRGVSLNIASSSLWICLSVWDSVYNAYNAKQMEMQSKTQVPPKLNFKPQVAIRLQNIETAMMFSWFLLASRLSIKLHNAKTVRSLCEACWLSPPWTRTGILCFGSGPTQRRWYPSKEYFLLKRFHKKKYPNDCRKEIAPKKFLISRKDLHWNLIC